VSAARPVKKFVGRLAQCWIVPWCVWHLVVVWGGRVGCNVVAIGGTGTGTGTVVKGGIWRLGSTRSSAGSKEAHRRLILVFWRSAVCSVERRW
jgi:hypothetical protein